MRVMIVCALLVACGPLEKAAANDPEKCERDPRCASKNSRGKDCSTQCVDNIECMQTCEQMQGHR